MSDRVEVTVRTKKPGTYQQEATARKHVVNADEPAELGGEDAAPMPTELMLSALGGCTSITCTMYAKRKGWKLERVNVRLVLDKVDGADVITREVGFEGELSDDERKRLLDIANKCPVHKMLSAGVKVETRARDA